MNSSQVHPIIPSNVHFFTGIIVYTYSIYCRMRQYLQGRLVGVDNNLTENAIRPLAISRKKFLFYSNHEAAENIDGICSLLATCRTQEMSPRE